MPAIAGLSIYDPTNTCMSNNQFFVHDDCDGIFGKPTDSMQKDWEIIQKAIRALHDLNSKYIAKYKDNPGFKPTGIN